MSASSTTRLAMVSPARASSLPKASRKESLLAIRAGLDIQKSLDLVAGSAQRQQGILGLRAGQLDAAMPGGNVFHIRHALALDGMGNDHRRLAGSRGGPPQLRYNRAEVMAVDFRHRPAEGPPFRRQRFQPHDGVIGIVALQLVVVDQGAK